MSLTVSSIVSGVLIPAAAVLVALVVGVAGAWVAYAVGFPRRTLPYGLVLAAPLLSSTRGVPDLELRHRGAVLDHPYILDIQVVSRGRKDIPRSAFDGDEPIRLDVGARIVTILQITSLPETLISPAVTVSTTKLLIGPSLIGKRQK